MLLATLIGHAVAGFDLNAQRKPQGPAFRSALFEHAGLLGVGHAAFFDWMPGTPEGSDIVSDGWRADTLHSAAISRITLANYCPTSVQTPCRKCDTTYSWAHLRAHGLVTRGPSLIDHIPVFIGLLPVDIEVGHVSAILPQADPADRGRGRHGLLIPLGISRDDSRTLLRSG